VHQPVWVEQQLTNTNDGHNHHEFDKTESSLEDVLFSLSITDAALEQVEGVKVGHD
jgi:hypothetical protein